LSVSQKYSVCNVRHQLQRSVVIYVYCHLTGRTAIWCWARPVSDS